MVASFHTYSHTDVVHSVLKQYLWVISGQMLRSSTLLRVYVADALGIEVKHRALVLGKGLSIVLSVGLSVLLWNRVISGLSNLNYCFGFLICAPSGLLSIGVNLRSGMTKAQLCYLFILIPWQMLLFMVVQTRFMFDNGLTPVVQHLETRTGSAVSR